MGVYFEKSGVTNASTLQQIGVPTISPAYTYPTEPINATMPLWLDSWYLRVGDCFGVMQLGLGPRVGRLGANAFLERHVRAVVDATPQIGSLATIQLSYVTMAQPRHIRAHIFSSDNSAQGWGAFVKSLQHMTGIVSGVSIHMSLQVAVHDEQQDIQWVVVPALVSLTPDIHGLSHYAEAPETLRVWGAQFDCDAASAFRRDNSSVLRAVRERWRLDRLETTSRRNRNTIEEDIGIVTLSEPPATTPETNERLYRINHPRLARMIALWEQGAQCVFEPVDSNLGI